MCCSQQHPYLSEWTKVLQAALTGDTSRATAYSNLLIEKMQRDGHPDAERVRRVQQVALGNESEQLIYPCEPSCGP